MLLCINSFGQQWTTHYAPDSTFSINVPPSHQLIDTLYSYALKAKLEEGTVLVCNFVDDYAPAEGTGDASSDLFHYYKDLQQKILDDQNGRLMKSELITIDDRTAMKFHLIPKEHPERGYKHFMLLIANENVYVIGFSVYGPMQAEKEAIANRFFSSIRLQPVVSHARHNDDEQQFVWWMMLIQLLPLVIIVAIILGFVILSKKKMSNRF
jgi:hypothetical protein